ncbi:MAG TPA: hypothetical protein VFV19_06385 [Candidatus Polarisedimenticolaceae bacterium]|nr:hypothetical protein [Candidatus Polarisedimenticolaceae bacterium]
MPAAAETAPTPAVPDEFPTQSPALAREMVTVSHFNPKRVKELLDQHPTLANASWDWGFGDWETALGAASHMGNLEIAQALLLHGARPSIFSAAMLGHVEVVKAFVEASPGIQGTPGPHGITLLAHAEAGGANAKPVKKFLLEVGGADPVPKAADVTAEVLQRYVGVYAFGPRDADRIEISLNKGQAQFKRGTMMARNLIPLGENAFHPAGAPAVRVRFVVEGEKASELTVFDPDLVLRARRTG